MITVENTKTIVWDLDGTLIDSFGIFTEVLAEVVPSYGRDMPTAEIIRQNYHGSLDDAISNVMGGLGPDELDAIVADFLRLQEVHYNVIEHHFYPDALHLAQRAHEAEIFQALVTNRNRRSQLFASPQSIVARSALSGLMGVIICGDDTEYRKPKPEVVGALLSSGLLVPAETVVIGDQFVDAVLARNLGAKAILVNRGDEQIAHMDRLGEDWESEVQIVGSLDEVDILRQ